MDQNVTAWEATSLPHLLELVANARESMDFHDGEECFFRGHSHAGWQLLPTLFRASSFMSRRPGDRLVLEYDLFYEFRSRARPLQTGTPTDWDLLFTMRHHGLPTRLLDWSESLGVALFFALDALRRDGDAGDAALWMLNPYLLNQTYGESVRDIFAPGLLGLDRSHPFSYEKVLLDSESTFGWDVPVAIYPDQREERMHAQRGWFTMHGDRHDALEALVRPEQILGRGTSDCVLAKIVLKREMLEEIRRHLDQMGVSTFQLFPDLDGLARDLIDKYRIRG